MTTNDRLQEAIEKYGTPLSDNRVVVNLDDVPRIAYRAGLDAVQPAPTDAEIEAAIEDLWAAIYKKGFIDAQRKYVETKRYDPMIVKKAEKTYPAERERTRSNLLRLIAQQREAAVLEALESVRELRTWLVTQISDDDDEWEYGATWVARESIAHIDAMLAKEDGDE